MIRRQSGPIQDLVFERISASKIGMWHWDIPNDQVTCDPMNAAILGLMPDEAEQGVPLQRVVDAVHPDDRIRFRETTASAREQGGSVTVELRTVPAHNIVRRVVVRGRYEADAGGRMIRGTGVLIDLTDLGEGSRRSEAPLTNGDPGMEQSALDRLVDYVIAARRAIDDLGEAKLTQMRLLTDMLLLEIGRHIARMSGGDFKQ